MSVTKDTILELCRTYGPQLHFPEGIDGPKIMYAIAGCESTWGQNMRPRHEPAYDVGGRYATSGPMPLLLAKWGSQAACSYGPWQVMLCNAAHFTPDGLTQNPEMAAQAFVGHMNFFVFGVRHAGTVEQIAQTYNSGNYSDDPAPGVLRYASQCREYYSSAPV